MKIKIVYFYGDEEKYCDIKISGRSKLHNDKHNATVIPLRKIRIEYDYPLGKKYVRTYVSRNGFSVNMLLRLIRKEYSEFFKSPAKFGVWGHSIQDLELDYIQRHHGNIFTLGISS